MRVFVLLAVALFGCGTPVPITPAAAADMATELPDSVAVPLDLEGRIIGLDQQPLPGVKVALCQKTCRDTVAGAQGEFAFPAVTPDFYTLRVTKPGASDYASLDFPLYLQSGANPRLLPLVLPKVDASTAVVPGQQTLAVDTTLTLSLDGSALTLPQGGSAGRLGGVRIPQGLYPDFCVPSARVLAMWAFNPTGMTSLAPIDIRIADPLGLLPDATVNFVAISPVDGRPVNAASGKVSKDGKSIQTALGTGVHQLSWLLAVVLQGGA